MTSKRQRSLSGSFVLKNQEPFAIVDQADGKLMGYLLFHLYDGESKTYEIGWVFHKAYWRQGTLMNPA